jgi:hypothetical protein
MPQYISNAILPNRSDKIKVKLEFSEENIPSLAIEILHYTERGTFTGTTRTTYQFDTSEQLNNLVDQIEMQVTAARQNNEI